MSKFYEITLPGFNGSTDDTDDHVLWVSAPDDFDMEDLALRHQLTVAEMSLAPEPIDINYVFPEGLVGFEEAVSDARMLGPVIALHQYAAKYRLSDAQGKPKPEQGAQGQQGQQGALH